MRKSLSYLGCLMIMSAPFIATPAAASTVDNNGTTYYDANTLFVDSTPTGPYTKEGQYIVNPDETVNTRDNRGMRPEGYNPEYTQNNPPPRTYDNTTVVVYPSGNRVVYPSGSQSSTTTTTVYTNE